MTIVQFRITKSSYMPVEFMSLSYTCTLDVSEGSLGKTHDTYTRKIPCGHHHHLSPMSCYIDGTINLLYS